MPKPYARIKDLSDLMQSIKAAYGVLLEQKKEDVRGIIVQYMGEIHTISGHHTEARVESGKADNRFNEYEQKITEAESLTLLDAMIRQIQVYAGTVLDRIHALLSAGTGKKVVNLRRIDLIAPRLLSSREEIDTYADSIREKLYDALGDNDGIQIN